MAKIYQKTNKEISLDDFLKKAKTVKNFESSTGKRYQVSSVVGDTLVIKRLDANQSIPWEINLKNLHQAYRELADFKTLNFKPYVPIAHSPSRGLLIHLNMLKQV